MYGRSRSNSGYRPPHGGGWELHPRQSTSFDVPSDLVAGRWWGRTGCRNTNGRFHCETGDCGPWLDCGTHHTTGYWLFITINYSCIYTVEFRYFALIFLDIVNSLLFVVCQFPWNSRIVASQEIKYSMKFNVSPYICTVNLLCTLGENLRIHENPLFLQAIKMVSTNVNESTVTHINHE